MRGHRRLQFSGSPPVAGSPGGGRGPRYKHVRRPHSILRTCQKAGVRLSVESDRLVAGPPSRVSPELADLLRQHRFEIIAELRRRESRVLHLATQIVLGEFEGASGKLWCELEEELG